MIDYNQRGHAGALDARRWGASPEFLPENGEAWECENPGSWSVGLCVGHSPDRRLGAISATGRTLRTPTQSVAGWNSAFRLIIRSVVLPFERRADGTAFARAAGCLGSRSAVRVLMVACQILHGFCREASRCSL